MPFFQSLRRAALSLRRSPSFSIAAALTLAIGIGSTTTIFSVMNTILIKPLPFRDADRLVGAWFSFSGFHVQRGAQSTATYFAYKRYSKTIEAIAIADRSSANLTDANEGSTPTRVQSGQVTASFFPLLGVPFELGRAFSEPEDTPQGAPVVVISDGLWRSRFGAASTIVGRPLIVDGTRRVIVGVVAPGFRFPEVGTEIWLPLALDEHAVNSGPFAHTSIARLRPDATLESAQQEFQQLLPRAAEIIPMIVPGLTTADFIKQSGARAFLRPMREDIVGEFSRVLWVAAVAGGLLLLIACGNVASLMLTRAEARRREVAVRYALGAGMLRVFSEVASESMVLSMVGAALGIPIAIGGVSLFRRYGPAAVPRLQEIDTDYRVIVFAIVVTGLVALVCSLVPFARYKSTSPASVLRDGSRGGTVGMNRQRLRRGLVIGQIAFAVVLVSGATLLLQSVAQLRRGQPGFTAEGALTMWFSLPPVAYPKDSDVARFTQTLLNRVANVPGVQSVGATSKVPLLGTGKGYAPVWADNDATPTGTLPAPQQLVAASGRYFAAMGIPLMAGRTFQPIDRQSSREIVMDAHLAAQFWGDSTGARAIGRRVHLLTATSPWYTVVGIVGAVHDTSLAGSPNGIIYAADMADSNTNISFAARTFALVARGGGDPLSLAGPVQRAVLEADRSLPAFQVRAMSSVIEESIAQLSFVMVVLAVVAFSALALAGVGLYGLIAYFVSLRVREIGIRIALGAQPSQISRAVSRQGLWLGGMGALVGSALFLVLSRLLGRWLYGVASEDAATVMSVLGILLVLTLCASWLPARRAARADPVRSLAAE